MEISRKYSEKIEPKIDYFPVRLCNKCSRVWEKPLRHTGFFKIIYHEDFPTYKLEEKTCPKCEEKNETD